MDHRFADPLLSSPKVGTMSSFEDFPADALLRVAMCSEANFSHWARSRGLEIELARLQDHPRKLERGREIGGIVYLGNRFYLQCVEGPRDVLDSVFHRIADDERHRRAKVLKIESISERAFASGEIKYVGRDEVIARTLREHGLEDFNPYRFDADLLDDFLAVCIQRVADA